MSLEVDGHPARAGRHFLTLATTLDRMTLGIMPFWGGGAGPVRWLDVAAPPRRPVAALLPTLRGRPRRWMLEGGYASGRASRVAVDLARPFVLDGELFEPGRGGVELSADQTVGFVAP
jgi:hypothetical protein